MGEARPLKLPIQPIFTFFACVWETMPQLHAFLLHMCTCKGKDKKPIDKQWKEKMQRAYERGIK